METTLEQIPLTSEIHFSDVSATALVTLYCRAIESQSKDPILKDTWAENITHKITPLLADTQDPLLRKLANGKVDQNLVVHIALRAQKYDEYSLNFLFEHPEGIIVNLGCGMDTRFFRIDNGKVEFFDIDLPELIDFKQQLIAPGERYHLIASSIFDYGWMDEVSAAGPRPILFLAEGVFMYLEPDRVRDLVVELQRRFSGSELVCEVFNKRWLSKYLKPIMNSKMQGQLKLGKGSEYQFGVADSQEMESWHTGIEFLDEWVYFDSDNPKLGMLKAFRKIELLRKTQWTVHYRLN
jgi:methyltransferase (TIGR00027 family)